MDFRCTTKEFQRRQQVFVKIVGDPMADETRWLPACAALAHGDLIRRSPVSQTHQNLVRPVATIVSTSIKAAVLSIGQIFMVAAAACTCGSLSSVLFGQSYDRVMYHSGPQDTQVGVFALLAIPLYWTGWFLHKHKWVKLALLLTLGPLLAFSLGTVVLGFPSICVALTSFLCLLGFLYCGSYLSSWKNSWPRKFKPTLWLSISYISAVIMLAFEFSQLNPDATIEHVEATSLLFSVGTIAAFALLPAFLTAVSSGTRRIASGFGLALIGQLPMLAVVLLYCLANAVMLACVSIFGSSSLAEYFARTAPGGLAPDFDLAASNQAELLSKLFSSLIVYLALTLSILAGALLGVFWNRRRASKC